MPGGASHAVVFIFHALAAAEHVLNQHHALGWVESAQEIHLP
jgi:hypothetical protein